MRRNWLLAIALTAIIVGLVMLASCNTVPTPSHENDIVITLIAGTIVFLMLVIALIVALIYANKAFRRGVKWAEEQQIDRIREERIEELKKL